MVKKTSLKSALTRTAAPEPELVSTDQAAPRPPSRQGKKQIAGFFSPEVARQLRVMAAEMDSSVQSLLTEALNDLFHKHGRPPVA